MKDYSWGWYAIALREGETRDKVCGTDRQIIYRDLKTLRGVKNRLKNWKQSFSKLYTGKNAIVRVEIYRFYDFYNDGTFYLMGVL